MFDLNNYFDLENIKGRYQISIASDTSKALFLFCDQHPEFLHAIEHSKKTYQECLDDVVKDIEYCCSDFEVYSRAVKFYFSTATVHFNMIIDLCGNNGYEAPPIIVSHACKEPDNQISISLDNLLNF